MNRLHRGTLAFLVILGLLGAVPLPAQEDPESTCVMCHGEADMWEGDDRRFHVTAAALAGDVHWKQGIRCHDCHGGDPREEDYAAAHAGDAGFRKIGSPADLPGFCGRCHSDIEYMRRFRPSARTDQESEFWTSGHGQRLKEDPQAPVATCTSCHGRHGIRAVDDLESPVYPTNVAKTCATCHADAERMRGLSYHGRPLGHSQYELWRGSVHGRALLKQGDLSAPSCNDCHGNHGALPPEVGSVANACGTCHGRIADLFEGTRMRHSFEEVGLPGCATCHGYHDISQPTDELLGMEGGAVCARCHEEGRHGATLAGAQSAVAMRAALEGLKRDIREAEQVVRRAERMGMEVRGPRFELQEARTALTEARAVIHTFAVDPLSETIGRGTEVAGRVREQALEALDEHESRRVWLAGSLVVIGGVVALLLLYLRRFPAPEA